MATTKGICLELCLIKIRYFSVGLEQVCLSSTFCAMLKSTMQHTLITTLVVLHEVLVVLAFLHDPINPPFAKDRGVLAFTYRKQQRSQQQIFLNTCQQTPPVLFSRENGEPEERNDITILSADIFGVAMACQLLGLADVLNDTSFWLNGGWIQPIPAIPPSLSILVQRISLNLLLLGAAAWIGQGYKPRSVASIESIRDTGLRMVGMYGLARIVLAVGIAFAVPGTAINDPQLLVGEALREVYCVSLASFAARYIVYLLYHR